ncbi:protein MICRORCHIDIA 7-like [Corylus avellana]|uniref:protein MICRORCHIDIA 7-like n=1 Tax=Corylus avellana TaxID=13451 RepID=UPI00286D2395|nr:protein MICRORCHIDIA 7-like [Corylus avellana]
MDACVKQELVAPWSAAERGRRNDDVAREPLSVIELSDSDSDSDSDDENDAVSRKKARVSKERVLKELGVVLPTGFLQALPAAAGMALTRRQSDATLASTWQSSCKQFWKAGDYEGSSRSDWDSSSVGMDHVRVHPKFLHSNATSHKWALGAFAELLDNSLDEVCNGATYVNIDMLVNRKDESKMLLIEDDGGGMDPDKMRQCMSLGYSAKTKVANTIGQYGNGFKTSTMRLGADVIVFSRCRGNDGKSPTQSIGLLSYTFLRSTGKEDIVVPMLDYERVGKEWKKIIRSSPGDWSKNVEAIVQWSPFSSEADLLCQFNLVRSHGTRIFIYNIWEDDEGLLELDFDADPHDIQIRGVNRDEKHIQMAKQYPNSRHFLTYRHSLRSYASILYLRLPPGFRIILRGKDVEHHNIVNDMMLSQEVTYRPNPGADGASKNFNMLAVVTIGFVKDAKHHIDVQGFNVYHKNRLIKPFWRLWNAAGSDGRGVIGVLEANFVEPAHDKQGFERTTVLARLEARLVQMQKNYWSSNCHRIGYAARRNKKNPYEGADIETSPDYVTPASQLKSKSTASISKTPPQQLPKDSAKLNHTHGGKESGRFQGYGGGHLSSKGKSRTKTKSGKKRISSDSSPSSAEDVSDDDMHIDLHEKHANGSGHETSHAMKSFAKEGLGVSRPSSGVGDTGSQQGCASGGRIFQPSQSPSKCVGDTGSQQGCASGGRIIQPSQSPSKGGDVNCSAHSLSDSDLRTMERLKEENHELKKRLEKKEGEGLGELLQDLQSERDARKSLATQLQVAQEKIEELNREQESLIDIFAEERDRRENEEKFLKKKLQDANNIIQELRGRIRQLEKM